MTSLLDNLFPDVAAYVAPRWLRGGHAQTIYPAKLIAKAAVTYPRERWDTPDGDFIDVDFVDGEPDKPLLVLFHGLEGSSNSHYAPGLMAAVQKLGWSDRKSTRLNSSHVKISYAVF